MPMGQWLSPCAALMEKRVSWRNLPVLFPLAGLLWNKRMWRARTVPRKGDVSLFLKTGAMEEERISRLVSVMRCHLRLAGVQEVANLHVSMSSVPNEHVQSRKGSLADRVDRWIGCVC